MREPPPLPYAAMDRVTLWVELHRVRHAQGQVRGIASRAALDECLRQITQEMLRRENGT